MNVADSRSFRLAREEEWRRLDALLVTCEKKSPRALSDEDLMELPILYRGALSSLSVARETSLDLEVVTYLEGLCARAYFFIYGVRTSPGRRVLAFFSHDWPAAAASLWRETLISLLLLVVGTIAGYLLVVGDSSWYGAFVPPELADGRDFSASPAKLRDTLYEGGGEDPLGIFATFLFTHNSQVAITCFAFGFAFGVPTVMLILHNGGMLGAILALFVSRGLGWEFGGWLIIHGSTELFAIVLAGAAGLRIGWTVVFPGAASRLAAASEAGKTAATLMVGVVIMLLVAGLLEGFGRQLIKDGFTRYAIGIGMLLLWMAFYYLPGGRRARLARIRPMADYAVQMRLADQKLRRRLVTPEGVDLSLTLATRGQRAAAFMLDLLIMLGILVGFTIFALVGLFTAGGELMLIIWLLGFFVLRNGYFIIMEMGPRAATFGKRVNGLRVVARSGARLTADAVIARNLLREIEFYLPLSFLIFNSTEGMADSLMWLIGLGWACIFLFFPFFNRDGLRVGDLLAGTWVISAPKRLLGAELLNERSEAPEFAFTDAQLDAYGVFELQTLERVLRDGVPDAMATVSWTIRNKIGLGEVSGDYAFLNAYYAALRARLERKLLFGRRRLDKHDI